MAIEKLNTEQLRRLTEENLFDFKTSNELTPAGAFTGQDHAVSVLRSTLSIPGLGCHVIALGKEDTGRLEAIYSVVKEIEVEDAANVDRVLLPIPGRHATFEEIPLQPGDARLFITACRNIIEATVSGKSEARGVELKVILEKFAGRHLLSGYLQWLDDATSTVLQDNLNELGSNEVRIRELHGMLPELLHSSQ